jgi:hypothetical protein
MSLRVIGAGLGRTGTNSLMTALETLLDGECHHMYKVFVNEEAEAWLDIVRGDTARLPEVLSRYVASCDWPSAAYWEQLAADNPDAVILLSSRASGEAWFKSASDTIFPAITSAPEGPWKEMVLEMLDKFVGVKSLADKDACIAAYDAHNAYVRANADPKRLVDWQATDGWAPICDALGLPIPEESFPHTHTTEEWLNRQ